MKSSRCFGRSTNKPLWVYLSRSKAKNSAQHINQRKKDKLIEYQCDRCKNWHLKPLARHTPSETCIHCKGRDGQNKQGDPTRAIAQKRVDIAVAFDVAWVLATLVQPNQMVSLSSGASLAYRLHASSILLGILYFGKKVKNQTFIHANLKKAGI